MALWLHDQISDMIHQGRSWQISFDRYSNDRSTTMVTALLRIIQAAQGHPIFGLWEHLYFVASVFLLYLSPGWSACTEWPSVGCIWLGSRGCRGRPRYWTTSKRFTILKIHSVTSNSSLCQKGSQYVAIDREGTTIRDFTPQDPFPGVSIDQPITFNQHPKNIYVIWVEGSHGSELGQLTLEMHQIIVTGRSIRGGGREVFAHPDQGKGWPFADNLTSGTWLGGRAQLADWRDHWRQLMGHRWPGHRLRAVLPSACYR